MLDNNSMLKMSYRNQVIENQLWNPSGRRLDWLSTSRMCNLLCTTYQKYMEPLSDISHRISVLSMAGTIQGCKCYTHKYTMFHVSGPGEVNNLPMLLIHLTFDLPIEWGINDMRLLGNGYMSYYGTMQSNIYI